MDKNYSLLVVRNILFTLLFLVSNLPAHAQIASHQKISNAAGGFTGVLDDGDLFGWVPANIGDLDGDGINELAVGTPADDDGGTDRGAVWILFLNGDGTVKSHQKISDTEGNFVGILNDADGFGHSAAPIGDFDGDGVNDLAVGALGDDEGATGRGALWLLFLSTNGTVKSHQKIFDIPGGFTGASPQEDGFGHGITLLGDLDNDNVPELATATGHNTQVGIIWVMFMNVDGTVKSHQRISVGEGNFTGTVDPDAELGHDLDALGDLDGDGVVDLAVGLRHDDDGGDDRGGLFVLFLDTDGTVKAHQKISQTQGGFTGALDDGDVFGHPPANAGDLDGDGVIDLLVGAPFDDDGGLDIGAFWILFLNDDGTVKAHEKISQTQGGFTGVLDEEDLFAHIVTAVGDLNNDGITDYAVGSPHDDDGGSDRGAVWVMFAEPPGGGNIAPTAAFGFGTIGLQVDFTDASSDNDGTVVAWGWDFGDGNISTAQNPTHTYVDANTYTVTLTVTDDGGLSNSISQPVTVGQLTLSVDPTSLDFGPQAVGTTSAPQALTLTNEGIDPIDVFSASIVGNNAQEFANDFLAPVAIPGSGQNTFNVTFTPTSPSGGIGGALYRVNAGGPLLPTEDSDPLDWTPDTADTPSPYVNSGDTSTGSITSAFILDASVPAGAPPALFETYRRNATRSAPNMVWDFPVTAGEPVEVRLYFIQSRGCSAGSKVLDVEIEGAVVFDNYDIVVDVGCDVGVMKSVVVTPMDTNLDIDLVPVGGGPPLVSGIEIVGTDPGVKTAQVVVEHAGSNPSLTVDLTGEGIGANLAPTADFDFNASGLQVDFTDASNDSDGTVVAWNWDFGDGNTSTEQNPAHTYSSANTYTVTLTVTDNGGLGDSVSQPVTVLDGNLAPTADFDFNASSLQVDFTDASNDSDGTVVAWNWDFGDGNTSTEQNPAHTYSSANTYTVTLTVTDNGGLGDSVSQLVTVLDVGASALYRVNAGGPLLPTEDSDPLDWTPDTTDTPSPYVNSGDTSTGSITSAFILDASVPAGAPPALFETYRRNATRSAPNMVWDFPVTAGEPVEVRLYFIQSRGCSAGSKVLDVEIEGAVVFDNYDIVVDVGCDVGVMKSVVVTPMDTNLDIDLVPVGGGPPLVSGIEIVGTGP